MYTTRSVFRPEPVAEQAPSGTAISRFPDCAVLLISHGSSRQPSAAASLQRHAQALRALAAFGEVEAACLIGGPPTPAEALARLTKETVAVVPLMMCDGWTTRQVIPQALGLGHPDADARMRRLLVCEPLGLHPAFAGLIADRAADRAATTGVPAHTVTLLLVAHGSTRSSASEQATETLAARIRATERFRGVATAYLEQPPRLQDVLATTVGPVIAVGCFAAPGHHATVDIAAVLRGHAGDGVADVGPIGDDEEIPWLLHRIAESRLAG